ncbi:MAG: UDP-N-acetylmuramoylalanyl-D-glutamyl-2,6-diaminopimelate/D-alanyl-D-alanyl ligase [Gemmatimonadetes bacterium]|nr:UDP-N-acetylmuramoylalanyl-D-glutamyl-2,6-diaminopimelate/D-alanyl-D-alanyl ligase [Gemmatimonadota bacterium]
MSELRWTAAEVAKALGTDVPGTQAGAVYSAVATDTRKVAPGSLFVALAGERFDAHDFLSAAAESGAAAAVVSRVPADAPAGLALWVVSDDTRAALGRLGRHRRRAFAGKVVGVCGSNGKTTTKELLRAALGSTLKVHATEANLNNQVGVPLTLLSIPDDADVAVVEMGTNEPGEIAVLTAIVEPDVGIMTSIGEEHLEGFGDVAGVFREETALLEGMPAGSVAIVAEEPEELPARAIQLRGREWVRVAGLGEGADLRPDGGADSISIESDGSTRWSFRGTPVHLPQPGRHNVRNALIAFGVAMELGVSTQDAARGIAAMPRPKLRGEWKDVGRMRVLADCYNSNPPSLSAAVDLLAGLPGDARKVAVVGTMRELGAQAEAIHRRAAKEIAALLESGRIDRVVATGEFVPAFAALANGFGDRLVSAEDPIDAYAAAARGLTGDETILLKGSRGVQLERWLPLLERDFGTPTE